MDPQILERCQQELQRFRQSPLSSFSSYFLWWPVELFVYVLFQGAQKENLTEQILAGATIPGNFRLNTRALLRHVFPGLFDEASGNWVGTFAVRAGNGQELPPLYFMFEATVFGRLVVERLGLLISQNLRLPIPQMVEAFMPFTLYMCLPSSTWTRCMRRLARLGRLQVFQEDVPWTSGMINFTFSLRSSLLFLLYNFTFAFEVNQEYLRENFVAFAVRVKFSTFMNLVQMGTFNLWNRRYRDFLMRIHHLDLYEPKEIASLVTFSSDVPLGWMNDRYAHFVGENKPLQWMGHVPVPTWSLRPQEERNLPLEEPVSNFLMLDLAAQLHRQLRGGM